MTEEIKQTNDTSLKMASGKGYQFRVKAPSDAEGLAELFNSFMEHFDVTFTLKDSKFKTFPKKFIIEDSIKEVDNIF